MTVRVVTAEQAAARDAAAIAAGTPSFELMRRAGVHAAARISERVAPGPGRCALVACGPGNNGGDGWVVAAQLARLGVVVHVDETIPARTPDAQRARSEAIDAVRLTPPGRTPDVVIDALLGTGARGELRGPIAESARRLMRWRDEGAVVTSLDLPTGVDATTGEVVAHAVRADCTISFGTVKRGHLLARSWCGAIDVVDIGLGQHADLDDGAPALVDAAWVHGVVPPIAADAHKGVRRRVLLVGGDRGMAGAVALAARGALRSGVGMVKLCVHPESLAPLQAAVPEATAVDWPGEIATPALLSWPHAALFGPGLGASPSTRARVERWLTAWEGPTVLDADALNAFSGDEAALGDLLAARPAIVTPHPLEFARLIGVDVDTVLAERFEIGARLARALHAVVVLKGVPTVVTAPDGSSLVCASGTPALGTAGSGDILAGIAVTLLAQGGDPVRAAAAAAWVHGRAAEIATAGRTVRGVTLEDVLTALGTAWPRDVASRGPASVPLLASLPRVGDG